jgi:hypothetical protein
MDEQRKYATLFAATILAARKLREIGDKLQLDCTASKTSIALAHTEYLFESFF